MYKQITGILVFFFCSCGANDTAKTTAENDTAQSSQTIHTQITDTVVTNAKPLVLNGCYQMTLKRDTVLLQLDVKDTVVTGDLHYDFYEKDRNSGTLQGVLRNDTILAYYTFQSEGVTSVREVIFKIEDGALLEGFGDLTEKEGRLVFTDKNDLQFHTANPFLKVACPR